MTKQDPNTIPVTLDADHCGSILAFLADYHTYLGEAVTQGKISPTDAVYTAYRMGNIEGRCLYDGLTLGDLELIDIWEGELDEWKAAHGDQIIVIPLDRDDWDDDDWDELTELLGEDD